MTEAVALVVDTLETLAWPCPDAQLPHALA
jgi:hypothetical protein